MNLHTIGFTKKPAKRFFTILNNNSIDLLVDIRLNNKSQLAGFAKGEDLAYFLREICNCAYEHCLFGNNLNRPEALEIQYSPSNRKQA